jgi:Domain of unknown function (DUF4258)
VIRATLFAPEAFVVEGEIRALSAWVCVRFSRHAKNRARELGISLVDVECVIETADRIDFDRKGLPRYTGYVGDLRVRVVVALDDPEVIVTIHERRK